MNEAATRTTADPNAIPVTLNVISPAQRKVAIRERSQRARFSSTASAPRQTKFVAGGTNLIDLMKCDVESPAHVVDINALTLGNVQEMPGGIRIGALACTADVAADKLVIARRSAAISCNDREVRRWH